MSSVRILSDSLATNISLLDYLPSYCENVLDFGAGRGYLKPSVEKKGANYFASEVDSRCITLLEEQDVVVKTLDEYINMGIKFDAIIVSSVLSEIINSFATVKEHLDKNDYDLESDVTSVYLAEHVGKHLQEEYFSKFFELLDDDGVLIIKDIHFGRFGSPHSNISRRLFHASCNLKMHPVSFTCLRNFVSIVTDCGFDLIKYTEILEEDTTTKYRKYLDKFGDMSYAVNLLPSTHAIQVYRK